jgi:choline dehydrogenase
VEHVASGRATHFHSQQELLAFILRLLTEAPSERKKKIHIPAAVTKLLKTPYDWVYYTEERPYLNNRRLYWPRGRVLGGCSSINYMIYIRGDCLDDDHWRDLGNSGWNFSEVLPYFKKAENQKRGASEYHGVGGPLNVADARYVNPLSRAFLEAAVEAGMTRNSDFNGPQQEGVGFLQVTQKQGRRHSAADAYLKPALNRPNLVVRTQAHVTRVQVERSRAVDVTYAQNGQLQEVRVSTEVILCGGAINSPQLLMLSGIGPANHLNALGIPAVVDLPGVGQNLQDHLLAPVIYACTQPVTMASAETLSNLLKYLIFKRGPLVSAIGEVAGFFKSKPGLRDPDLALLFGAVYFLNHGIVQPKTHHFSIGPSLMRLQSRRHLCLRSNDPLEPPAIQPNYLSCQADLEALVKGVNLLAGWCGRKRSTCSWVPRPACLSSRG